MNLQLMNIQGITEMVQRDRGTVRSWYLRRYRGFPEPAGRMNGDDGIPFWHRIDVELWFAANPDLMGGG